MGHCNICLLKLPEGNASKYSCDQCIEDADTPYLPTPEEIEKQKAEMKAAGLERREDMGPSVGGDMYDFHKHRYGIRVYKVGFDNKKRLGE